jgi:uncharacterized membrane protein (Fun14 family)
MSEKSEENEFTYPVESTSAEALADSLTIKMLLKKLPILWLFHFSMGVQLVSGLIMQFVGPWAGTNFLRFFHGFVGAFYIITFLLYIGKIAVNEDFRLLREPINYIEILFYLGMIILGLASSSFLPGLLPFLGPITSFHCTLLTFGWIAVSIFGGGSVVQGLSAIFFLFLRSKSKKDRGVKD